MSIPCVGQQDQSYIEHLLNNPLFQTPAEVGNPEDRDAQYPPDSLGAPHEHVEEDEPDEEDENLHEELDEIIEELWPEYEDTDEFENELGNPALWQQPDRDGGGDDSADASRERRPIQEPIPQKDMREVVHEVEGTGRYITREELRRVGRGRHSLTSRRRGPAFVYASAKDPGSEPQRQWAVGDGTYRSVGRTCPTVPAGLYTIGSDWNGTFLATKSLLTDDIFDLPDAAATAVLDCILKFWSSRDRYIEHGMVFKRGVMMWGPQGCLHGDTPIYDPMENTVATVARRHAIGKPFHVYAEDGCGNVVVALATPPVKYEPVPMVEMVFDTGESVKVTYAHRSLTVDGYDSAEQLSQRLLEYGFVLLPTNSDISRRAHAADDLRSKQTSPGFRYDCLSEGLSHHGDEQPLLLSGSARCASPSPDGVPEHTLHYLREDGQVDGSAHTRAYQSSGRPSMPSYSHQSRIHHDFEFSPPRFVGDEQSYGGSYPTLEPPPPVYIPVRTTLQRGLLAQESMSAFPLETSSFTPLCTTDSIRLISVRQVGKHPYFDFHVPQYENYWACGVFHHNSGKTVTTNRISQKLIESDGIVVMSGSSSHQLGEALHDIRSVEANRPIIAIMEDIDEMAGQHSLLALLDGENQVANVVYLATTNFPERLGARFMNRPSRFDLRVFVDMPSAEVRAAYLKMASKGKLTDADVAKWTQDSDGFSISHLKEMIVSVLVLDYPYAEALARIKGMAVRPNSAIYHEGFLENAFSNAEDRVVSRRK